MAETELGNAIKELRKALGNFSQERFAHFMGVTTRTAARWEASEKLSPQVLTNLRFKSIGLGALSIAGVFEKKLKESTFSSAPFAKYLEDPSPGTPEECQLVGEFLTRYREEDPDVRPIVEKLWTWIGERQTKPEREYRAYLVQKRPNETLEDWIRRRARRKRKKKR
jgi:transcriptional regulator with XRE-family HTH domain